ncbi:MAG: glycosyltransferase family 2 protein [Chloracidobacterium sp.]|nr:glycosyltransferase family 2 protein [Chloracidobacterium sp.]MDW8216359.1 glycosyltransferase family A protein [Acidobacteriota bacterium]
MNVVTAPAAGVFVVVPSYGHARFVARTLRSIFRQTQPPTKLLVIDDASPDDSARIIAETLAECPFPCELIVHAVNRGLCATLNEALGYCNAPYFAYLGSDDLWLPDFLATRAAMLEARPPAVLAYGHALVVNADDDIVDDTRWWARYTDGDVRAMLLRGGAPMSSTVLYRTAALARFGWNERARLEDYELYLRLCRLGDFALDAEARAAWRRHGRNTSRDVDFMLTETLAAQARAADWMGLSDVERRRAAAELTWTYAEAFARAGARRRAAVLAWSSWSAAPGWRARAKMAARLLLPAVVEKRRQALRARVIAWRCGNIAEQMGRADAMRARASAEPPVNIIRRT